MSNAIPVQPALLGHPDLTELPVSVAVKEKALQVLDSTPLPTTRTEAWRYTRVAKLGKIDFRNDNAKAQHIDALTPDPDAPRLVFINGHFHSDISSIPTETGISVETIHPGSEVIESQLPLDGELFNALNTACLHGGCRIHIDAGAVIEKPLQIIHVLKGHHIQSNFRTQISVGKQAKASVIQGFFSEGEGINFCNNITEIQVADNAHFTLEKIQYEGEENFHISTEDVQQAKDSTCTINTVTLNGGLVRNNIHVAVNGVNCTSNLRGAYLLKGRQHVDNHTVVDHKVAHCESNELYKGVADDQSTAVFNGKVYVRPDAQKINAFQSNANVLLSDDASINSKPELEIYADDVKCSHGSTTGQLDEDAIFYLRARGISSRAARQLMVAAFVEDVLEKLESPALLNYTHRLLHERFGWEF